MTAALLASIPSPSSGTISIGPLELRAYGLMIALGVIAAVWLLGKLFVLHGIGTSDDAGSIGVWGVVAGVIGSRLYHVITDWSRFSDDLGAIPRIWEGGLGIPGGLIAGVLVGCWQAKRRGIPVGMGVSLAAPSIALAQAIGRWGNWFNQELFGEPTELPWGLEIDAAHLPPGYPPGTLFHPTFLYESLWNFALCGLLLLIHLKLRLGPGRLMAVYLVGYGTGRFWIEGLRIDPASEVGGLRWNQWMALAAVVSGVVWLVATRGRRWPDELWIVGSERRLAAEAAAEAAADEIDDGDVDAEPTDADEIDDAEPAADAEPGIDEADIEGDAEPGIEPAGDAGDTIDRPDRSV